MLGRSRDNSQDSEISTGRIDWQQWQWLFILAVICLVLTIFVAPYIDAPSTIPTADSLSLHVILELSSVVISFAVFIMGWYGYKHNNNIRDLVIGLVFFTAGFFDLLHTLNYKGMPGFLTTPGAGSSAAFWVIARTTVGLGLLIGVLLRPQTKSRWLSPWVLLALFGGLIIGVLIVAETHDPHFGYLFFDPVKGLTHLKKGLEYMVIAFSLMTMLLVSPKKEWGPRRINALRSAMVLVIFAEFALTLYQSPYAYINILGHLFKAAAYGYILRALFVSAVTYPYEELEEARDEIQLMYYHAMRHREEMEKSFSRIGSALSSGIRLDEALDRIAQLAIDIIQSDCAVVATSDRKHQSVKYLNNDRQDTFADLPGLILKSCEVAFPRGSSVVIQNLPETDFADVSLDSEGMHFGSMLCSPMILDDKTLGMIAVYSRQESAFDEDIIKLIEAFATHAAVAVDNAISYERESRIADVLQRSFLTSADVTMDGFDIAQSYHPATNEALVGGDFYDIIDLSIDKIGLVIGDVSGKGLQAAVHTAMVKYSLRAYASEGRSPAECMRLLDSILSSPKMDEMFVTMFYGVLDLNTGSLVYANGGHEPPIHLLGGTLSILKPTGPALGLNIKTGFREEHLTIDPGSILLLYTDGISEARHDNILLGIEGIENALKEGDFADAQDVARHIYTTAIDFAGGTLKDDAAVLALKRKPE